jgi:methionyl-tRNA synthetase
MKSQAFYLTTTLPYVNADPHIGFAMELVRADAIVRYKKLIGCDVFFNTGTDEHGQKLYDEAKKAGKDVKDYVDYFATKFRELPVRLGISSDVHFIRTTDAHHVAGARELWKRVRDNGFIYKKLYQTKYCVGCELEKTDSELVDGKCEWHPNAELEMVDEENYFFKFSAFQDRLLELYETRPDFVVPDFRMNEIRSFVAGGLLDFSVSRLKSKMSWGVPVPDDDEHVMYVWFDALANYITTLGWPENGENFEKYWCNGTPIQYAGQDNLRQQSAMWQAILMAADLPTSHQIHINGFIMGSDGRKMSKSLGNGVNPIDLLNHYGSEALRYYLLHYVHPYDGSPVGYESIHQRYTADLVNGIGNLTSRLMNLCEKNLDACPELPEASLSEEWITNFEHFRSDLACGVVMRAVAELDLAITTTEPFKLIKTDPEQAKELLKEYVVKLSTVARMLNPIMPETSQKMKECIKSNKKPEEPLFPRLEIYKPEE